MVRQFCDRIGVMYLGHLVELTDSDSLYEDPLRPYPIRHSDSRPGRGGKTGTDHLERRTAKSNQSAKRLCIQYPLSDGDGNLFKSKTGLAGSKTTSLRRLPFI